MILYLLVVLLGVGVVLTFEDSCHAHGRVEVLERWARKLNPWLVNLEKDVKASPEQLVDGLWQRASAEVDQEIERARARGRNS